jgi:phospholipase D
MARKSKKISQRDFVLKSGAKHPVAAVIFLAGAIVGYNFFEYQNPAWEAFNQNYDVNFCFTPGGRCTALIVREISKAKREIKLQGYSFTSQPIAEALVVANKRGVRIDILIDRSQFKNKYSVLPLLHKNGIAVHQDKVPGIAHNKVIIIDGQSVITGSFNFTAAAQNRNSENVVLLRSKKAAELYEKNWNKRQSDSK